jgi:hypothetical protein
LWPLVDEDLDLAADLVLRQCPALELLVAHAEGAVEAVVGAQVGDVERGEEHEARAVDRVLDEQHRDILVAETLELGGLGQDLMDSGRRRLGVVRQGLLDRRRVDARTVQLGAHLGIDFLEPPMTRCSADGSALNVLARSPRRQDPVAGGRRSVLWPGAVVAKVAVTSSPSHRA